MEKEQQSAASEEQPIPAPFAQTSSQNGTTPVSSSMRKPSLLSKAKEPIGNVLRPRRSVMAELKDISLVGGIYGLVFFTAKDRLLSSLIASIFSVPGLAQDSIGQMGNLLMATFPLSIGTAIVTVGYIGKLRFIRKIELKWNPFMGLLFACTTIWICTWIGTLMGVGGVSNVELTRLIDGPFYVNCHPTGGVPGTVVSQTTQNCTFIDASQLYGIWLFLYYLFAFVIVFWRIYGFGTFVAALVLGVYLSWAVFYKLASHVNA